MSAYTQADLDSLRRALVRGERTVQFADRSVTYRSLDEIVKAIQVVEASLSAVPRTLTGSGDKGF